MDSGSGVSETFLPVTAENETLTSSPSPSSSTSSSSSSSGSGCGSSIEATGNPSPNPNSEASPNPNLSFDPSPNPSSSPNPSPSASPSPSPDHSPRAECGSGARKTAWKKIPNSDVDTIVVLMGEESWPALSRQKNKKQPRDLASGSQAPDTETARPQQGFVSTVDDSSKVLQGNGVEGHIRNSPKAEDKVPVAATPPPIASATNQVVRFLPTEIPANRPPLNNFARGGGQGGGKPSWQNRGGAPEPRDSGRFQNNTWNNRNRHPREVQTWNSYNRPYNNGWEHGGLDQTRAMGPGNFPFGNTPIIGPNQGFVSTLNFQNGPGSMPYYVPFPVPLPLYPNQDGQFYTPPGIDHANNIEAPLRMQIEYYFSTENLCKDIYLRKQMDRQGFVPLSLISGFNRVQTLTRNPDVILQALRQSTVVEVQPSSWLSPDSCPSSGEVIETRVTNFECAMIGRSGCYHCPKMCRNGV